MPNAGRKVMRSLGVGVLTGALILAGFWLLDMLGVQHNLLWTGAVGGFSGWIASLTMRRFVRTEGGD